MPSIPKTTVTGLVTPNSHVSPGAIPGEPLRGDFSSFGPGFRGWASAGTSFLAVLTLALVGLQFALTMIQPDLNDPDIWWHMRDAQYLLQQHHFVRQDMYSFTAAGKPWVNTEWLSEIPLYLAYQAFGVSGLKALTFVLPSIILLLLLYLCFQESRNFKASVVVCVFASLLAKVSYGPRTILFGYILMVAAADYLAAFSSTRNRAAMDCAIAVLHLGEYARFVGDRTDFVFPDRGCRTVRWFLGKDRVHPMDGVAGSTARAYRGRVSGGFVHQSVWMAAGLLSL